MTPLALAVVAATILSLFLLSVGLIGALAPGLLLRRGRLLSTPAGLWFGFSLRLALALSFWFAAPATAAGMAIRVLAVLIFLGALAIPVLGMRRIVSLVEWWLRTPAWVTRAAGAITASIGLFVLWQLLYR